MTSVDEKVETSEWVTFHFSPDASDESRRINRSKALEAWPNARLDQNSISFPLIGPTNITYCMGNYYVECLRKGEDPKDRKGYDCKFWIPTVSVREITSSKLKSPYHPPHDFLR